MTTMDEWLAEPKLWALAYASMGLRVLPLRSITPDGDCDCGRQECAEDPTKGGKHPRTAHGYEDASLDEARVREWWAMWPTANVGIATFEDLVVIDIDPRHGGDETWAALLDRRELPPCPTVRTGSGGSHFYFAGTVARQGARALGPGVDVKALVDGRGGYLVAPPSVAWAGPYTWEAIGDGLLKLPALPDWLHPPARDTGPLTVPLSNGGEIDPHYALGALRGEAERARNRRDGECRRDELFRAGLRLSHFVPPLLIDDVIAVMTAAGVESGLPSEVAASHVTNGLRTALEVRS